MGAFPKHESLHSSMNDFQIWSAVDGLVVGTSSALSHIGVPIKSLWVCAEPTVVAAIHVLIEPESQFLGRLSGRVIEGPFLHSVNVSCFDGTVLAVITWVVTQPSLLLGIGWDSEPFRAEEVWEQRVPVPSRVSELFPSVVVGPVSSNVI